MNKLNLLWQWPLYILVAVGIFAVLYLYITPYKWYHKHIKKTNPKILKENVENMGFVLHQINEYYHP